jgi:hypothetical protein
MHIVRSIPAPSAGIVEAPPATPEIHPLADPEGGRATPDEPETLGQPVPTHGTGVRNGLVRTRKGRCNTFRALLKLREDRGAATAEYIVATMAAVGFAGLLIVILRGDEVRGILTELVRSALSVG